MTMRLVATRVLLEPLAVAHAEELVGVLADPALYAVTGGEPPSLDRLRERYRAQLAGPAEPGERWHNWVVRLRDGDSTGPAIGYVQATVTGHGRVAELAWVVGVPWQGNGYAAEAAAATAEALRADGVTELQAHVAPGHAASEAVARRVGLRPTGRLDSDGEQLWRSP
jgi:RimJ/RimL family protein N-acetyltransferase